MALLRGLSSGFLAVLIVAAGALLLQPAVGVVAAPTAVSVPSADTLAIRVAVLETKFDAQVIALELQAKEYERRLDILNGEAERLRSMQLNYIPREVYETAHAPLVKDINDLKEFRAGYIGRQAVVTVVIAACVSLLFLLVGAYVGRIRLHKDDNGSHRFTDNRGD